MGAGVLRDATLTIVPSTIVWLSALLSLIEPSAPSASNPPSAESTPGAR